MLTAKPYKPRYPFTINQASAQSNGLVFWAPGTSEQGQLANIVPPFGSGSFLGTTSTTGGRWREGKDGNSSAMTFNGTDNVVTFSENSRWNFSTSGAFTINAWIKTSASGVTSMIFSNSWNSTATTNGFIFYVESGANKLKFFASTFVNNGAVESLTGNTAVNDGKWHNVALLFNNLVVELYVDGVLDNSTTFSAIASGATLATSTYPMMIGGNTNITNADYTNFFTGQIEDAKVYNKALPYATTKSLYEPAARWRLRYQSLPTSRIAFRGDTAPASFTASPTAVPANNAANIVLSLTGISTSWDGTTVFDISGVSGVTKITQSVSSSTAATVTITTGSTTGTLTITESVTGSASTNVSVGGVGGTQMFGGAGLNRGLN